MSTQNESQEDQPLLRERRGSRRRNPLSLIAESDPKKMVRQGFRDAGDFLEGSVDVIRQVYWGALVVFVLEIVLTILGVNIWRIDWWGGLGFNDSQFLHHGIMTIACFVWWLGSSLKVSINSFLKRWGRAQEIISEFGMEPLGLSILWSSWRVFSGLAIWIVWSCTYFVLAGLAVWVGVSIVAAFGI